MNENTEQNLVERANNGDPAAIAELFKKYWRAARATAYGIIGNIDIAEDAASEAMFSAIKNIEKLKDTGKFGPWLRTIVIRSAKHHNNSNSVRNNKNNSEILYETNISSDISDMEKQELSVLIREAVSNLRVILRETISLYYFEGYNVERIADFLDIPTGTVKRRLHDGRNALREAAQKILMGKKPMNDKRDEILKQINDFLETGGDAEAFHKIAKQAMSLRPLPYELLGELVRKHSRAAKKLAQPGGREELELRASKVIEIMYKPSPRTMDVTNPVGKTLAAIKKALPEFKEWQVEKSQRVKNFMQIYTVKLSSSSMPPGFAEGIPVSFMSLSKGMFFEKEDGLFRTPYELEGSIDNETFRTKGKISDTLHLIWLRKDTIELHSIEELLRGLSEKIVPNMKLSFSPYDEPRFRSALRMRFDDIPIPAATGGVLFTWPGLPEGVSVASIQLYLEAWASAQSGQTIELEELSPFLEQIHKKEESELP